MVVLFASCPSSTFSSRCARRMDGKTHVVAAFARIWWLQRAETRSLLTEKRKRSHVRIHRRVHTSPMELQNEPSERKQQVVGRDTTASSFSERLMECPFVSESEQVFVAGYMPISRCTKVTRCLFLHVDLSEYEKRLTSLEARRLVSDRQSVEYPH